MKSVNLVLLVLLIAFGCAKKQMVKEIEKVNVKKSIPFTVVRTAKATYAEQFADVVVNKGSCYWKEAVKAYDNGHLWPSLYDDNKAVTGQNPNLVKERTTIKVRKVLSLERMTNATKRSYKYDGENYLAGE